VSPARSQPLNALSWSLGLTALLAAMLAAATAWLGLRMQMDEQLVRHTLAVQNQIADVRILVQSMETSQRGYLLTGRDSYLGPYKDAETALPAAIDETAKLVADNPQQEGTVARLRQVIAEKLRTLRAPVDEQSAGRPAAARAVIDLDRGQQLMDQIRQLLSKMGSEEGRLLTVREQASKLASILLQIGAATAFVLICAVGVLVRFHTWRSFAELIAARDRLDAANRRLIGEIEQRKATEGQLRQAQKMKAIGDLTGGIAHDFNNMLSVIAASLNLIQRHIEKGNFGIERLLEAANEANERAASLTRRLLAFARKQPLSPQTVDANKMIVQMSALLRSTLGEHIKIETVAAAGLWTANADVNQLENAILNVAINARDAMPDGGRLTIETGNAYLDDDYCKRHPDVESGQFVLIAITDTGAGMPPEVVARAFDPFFTTKPSGLGTGLGLSQVYGFIKQSRGHIKIYSEPGAGTTVKIYLPRSIGEPKDIAGTSASPLQKGTPDVVVLLVEDDALMRELAGNALHELGYTVLDSKNAANALAILDNRPDVTLLFTDVVMPDMDGKKLAEEAIRRRPGLKVLFMTGYTPNAVVHGGVLDPGVQLLSKPFTLGQLASKIRAALDARALPA
jgi:signal transduction histidine kinase/CheY-like chemotaxis protein